jgi:uncharacterized phage protein gp47/JayE
MAMVIRDFETMVDETLQRIVNADIGITNIMPGSVIRTIVEALLAETDIQNYTVDQIYKAMNIDTATGIDLDNIVAILGVTRKKATYAEGIVTFGRSDIYDTDIAIQYAQMVSTRKNNSNGITYEFIVIDDNAKLKAGELQTIVNIRSTEPGAMYLPAGSITIMNTPVIGIEYVTNLTEFRGGTDEETDESLRQRAKQALAGLGKGTNAALRSALLNVSGVVDAIVLDLNRGVGTSDIVVITNDMPPSTALMNEIEYIINITKSAGIDVGTIYPSIYTQDISVTITDITGAVVSQDNINSAGNAIVEYCNSMSVGDVLIVSQLERVIGNAIDDGDIDVIVTTPSGNISTSSTQVIRCGTITINGTVWDGGLDG